LVDEWFINMDWRDEIKDVTRTIEWVPEPIQGQEREIEWLSTMRDWMISKKRFWGLALPIWVNPDDPTDFKVVGDLNELKRLATDGGEGWEQFEGHTPHRPWIDAVKIPSDKHPGQLLTRVEDVGNPWLDAGIVPFSTLNFNRHYPAKVLDWSDWFPAHFVTECFPGQFRNWFYSLLALSTMMRHRKTPCEAFEEYLSQKDQKLTRERAIVVNEVFSSTNEFNAEELVQRLAAWDEGNRVSRASVFRTLMQLDECGMTRKVAQGDDSATYQADFDALLLLPAEEKRPFKTLLGHRLVMDEQGQPMHKSDGTAIWFEEAAEQLGVDTLRWMYLAQNPAADLRFGTRHPDEPVELLTPDGPITETKEGLPTCRVTSKPADEIRRQVLIPLWNSYAFFVNYAVADEFDPTRAPVPLGERPQIDRWILSRLQELTGTAHEAFRAFDVARFMSAAATFIDDLSNWYIRRNRRRFWRSKDANDADKLAAYQTLYEVLVTLTKLLAPCVPFLSERMYQNLTASGKVAEGQSGRGAGGQGGKANQRINESTNQLHDVPRSPDSVHLCGYPVIDEAKLDVELNRRTALTQRLVRLGHRLRESAEQRVRQPLAELRFACPNDAQARALEAEADLIADELNVNASCGQRVSMSLSVTRSSRTLRLWVRSTESCWV
jgi:isoleucyl-tRNA synthetase